MKNQIEKMAQTCPYNVNGECMLDETRCTTSCEVAIWGYRKASEVAREIFEEIERVAMSKIDTDLSITALNDTYYIEAIDEVKKKYESEETECQEEQK